MKQNVTIVLSLIFLTLGVTARIEAAKSHPNILFITVDDMNCDRVGAFGCRLAGTTPNIGGTGARFLARRTGEDVGRL